MPREMISRSLQHFFNTADGPRVHLPFAGDAEPAFDLEPLECAIKSAREQAGRAGVAVFFRPATNVEPRCHGVHLSAWWVGS